MQRDHMIEFFQSLCVFSKICVHTGTQQRSFYKSAILPKRLITILNGKFIFPLLRKNLGPSVKGWPKLGIDLKRRVHVALCSDEVALLKLFFRGLKRLHRRSAVRRSVDNDGHARVDNSRYAYDCHRECKELWDFH